MCTRKNVSSKPYKAFWSYKKVGAHQICIKDKQKLHLQTSPNTLFAGLTNIVLEYHISFWRPAKAYLNITIFTVGITSLYKAAMILHLK